VYTCIAWGTPPRHSAGVKCRLGPNEFRPGPEKKGYCGLRKNEGGKIGGISSSKTALAYIYFDPVPTNCCAAWFCEDAKEKGCNPARAS